MESGRLGNAAWIPPAVFAERCPYEDGTFWVGRSPETAEPLGYVDDRHILLGSGTRAGKGTTTILNNLCVWPGSVVVVDPKGENATVTAARRGAGSEYCEGMGQTVRVLDPFAASKVGDDIRGCYNPLDELDPTDPVVGDTAAKIASAIVVEQKGLKEPFWKESARKLVKGVILHVLTSPRYDGRRNLVTVRELISRGDVEGVKMLQNAGKKGVPSGHELLWEGMSVNEELGGVIAATGDQMAALVQADTKLFHSMLQSVDRETEWLDSPLMRRCVERSNFKLSDLKRDPNGISIYLCMPEGHMGEHTRWLRMMLTLVVQTVEAYPERPASGHRILMVMDEFLALERIKAVERAASYIAGFHLTMVFVVQGLSELQETYGKGWENIVGNCGLKIFFAVDEPFAREYISKMIGDTEVRPDVHTTGSGSSTNKARSRSVTESDTDSESRSRSLGSTTSRSTTESTSRTNSVTDTSGRSQSRSASSSRNRSRTDSFNESTADTRGSSQSRSRTDTLGWNDSVTDGSNWNKSHTDSQGISEGGSWSPRKLLLRGMDDWTHWLRENETRNMSTNKSSSDTTSEGGSHSRTRGQSGSVSEGVTDTVNQSRTSTLGRGESHTEGESESLSLTDSESSSRSIGVSDTVGQSETRSDSQSETNTVGQTSSHTTGRTEGTTTGEGTSTHQSVSESVHARRLVPPEDIGRLFDRPPPEAPGRVAFGLVIVGGSHPTVVVRTPYFQDPFFGWLFDPHPDHATPPKLVGPERFMLPSSGEATPLQVRLEPLKLPGDVVERGDLVAELVEPISTLDDVNEEYAIHAPRVRPSAFGFPEPLPADLRFPVYAQTDGEVVEILGNRDLWREEGDAFLVLEVNRRRLYESGMLEAGDDLARYVGYLMARKDQERAGHRKYQADRERSAAQELETIEREQKRNKEAYAAAKKTLDLDLADDAALDERAERYAKREYLQERPDWYTDIRNKGMVLIGSALVLGVIAGLIAYIVASGGETGERIAASLVIAAFAGAGGAALGNTVWSKIDDYLLREQQRSWANLGSGRLFKIEIAIDYHLSDRFLDIADRKKHRDRQRAEIERLEDESGRLTSQAADAKRVLDRVLRDSFDPDVSSNAQQAIETKKAVLDGFKALGAAAPTEKELQSQQADFFANFGKRLKNKPDDN